MTEDDFEEQITPGHGQAKPRAVTDQPSAPTLSDSQRDWFAQRLTSGVPVVQTRDTPTPTTLLARTTTPDELELLRHFRLAGDRAALAEFVVKLFAEHRQLRHDLNAKIEGDSSDNQSALQELRELLARPPNGRVKELQARVDKLEEANRSAGADDRVQNLHLEGLRDDAKFAKNAAISALIFLLVSIGGAGIWLGIREEKLNNVIDSVKDHDREIKRLRWPLPKDNTP